MFTIGLMALALAGFLYHLETKTVDELHERYLAQSVRSQVALPYTVTLKKDVEITIRDGNEAVGSVTLHAGAFVTAIGFAGDFNFVIRLVDQQYEVPMHDTDILERLYLVPTFDPLSKDQDMDQPKPRTTPL
jgi:hypothetical protein